MSMIGYFIRVTHEEPDSYLQEPDLIERRIDDPVFLQSAQHLDLEKSWDGIFFLLTGEGYGQSDHPLASVFCSGQYIDEEQDLGYGPGQYLLPEQVVDLTRQIAVFTPDFLLSRYHPEQMKALQIYPDIWEEEDAADYLFVYFAKLVRFFNEASSNGEAIVTFIA